MGRKKQEKWEREAGVHAIGYCESCGKNSYTTRKNARAASRRAHGRNGRLNAYPCPQNEEEWHYGNMPAMIARGMATRDDLRARNLRRA